MTDKEAQHPNIRIDRVYTRTGDRGQTSLVGGQRVFKSDVRIEAYGSVDELNAHLGHARSLLQQELAGTPQGAWMFHVVSRTQHQLFNLGSTLATLMEDLRPSQPVISEKHVAQLERAIDACNEDLEPLTSFVLPGGSPATSTLHVCRTVCRRAERAVVRLMQEQHVDPACVHFLNRLSDALFVWSRWVDHVRGEPEHLWDPTAS